MPYYRIFYLLLFLIQNKLFAQWLTIDSIHLIGHRKTKSNTILRELTFKEGDSIKLSELGKILEFNKLRLMNTALFSSVKMNLKNWDERNHARLEITMSEAWYIFPIPIFELADRNFNVWWDEQGRSIERTNYGIRTTYRNVTGRKDPLQVTLQGGYTARYSLAYTRPLNYKQTISMTTNVTYTHSRETSVQTIGNKLSFLRDQNKKMIVTHGASVGFSYRPKLFTTQSFSMGYGITRVADTVIQANPEYFLSHTHQQKYFHASYGISYDTRDNRPYPHDGMLLTFNTSKNGLLATDQVNNWWVYVGIYKYFPLGERWTLETILRGRTNLMRQREPYGFSRALGYGSDVIRGYQYYVVDGKDFAYLKTGWHYRCLTMNFDIQKWSPIRLPVKKMPILVYTALVGDVGKVNDPFQTAQNPLGNRWLYGGGVALNIVFFYNLVYQFEYNWNHLGERALFFSYRTNL